MKALSWLLLGTLSLTGCATSTIESRKQERLAAYNALSAEHRLAVDIGQIKIGMPMDAVYIAWGKPSQILAGESAQGAAITWLYHRAYLEEYRYWTYHDYCAGGRHYASPYLAFDYYPRSYVSAEVRFAGELVKEWRSLPQPGY
jgi:hypothetical protein